MEENYEKKIEIIKERTGLSEEAAAELLNKYNGDVIEALIQFERTKQSSSMNAEEDMTEAEFISCIKKMIKAGNVTRIIIRKDNEALVNIPVNAGVVIGLIMILEPVLLVLGAATTLVTKLEIDIVKSDGSVQVINAVVKNAMNSASKCVSDVIGPNLMDKIEVGFGKLKKNISDIGKK